GDNIPHLSIVYHSRKYKATFHVSPPSMAPAPLRPSPALPAAGRLSQRLGPAGMLGRDEPHPPATSSGGAARRDWCTRCARWHRRRTAAGHGVPTLDERGERRTESPGSEN